MPKTVLHVLSQRPARTGSGITLEALTREAAQTGWNQHAVVGVPADDETPIVEDLPGDNIHPLVFGKAPLSFDLPGMSDVMPYPTSRFSDLSDEQITTYVEAWKKHLSRVIDTVQPDIIHSHHIWLVSSVIRDVAPDIPIVTHCHATGFRQMDLCPHIAARVREGCGRNDRFVVLHQGHAEELNRQLHVPEQRITVVGAGFNPEHFHNKGRSESTGLTLAFVGKFSRAKGLPWLLDAVERLQERLPDVRLHVAGAGSGPEAEALEARMRDLSPTVVIHGRLDQPDLGTMLRGISVLVLPSFYEGLPLSLIEGLACGCRLVSTALPGVVETMAPSLDESIQLIPLPRLKGADVPVEEDLPTFVAAIEVAVQTALEKPPLSDATDLVRPFQWKAVYSHIESVWTELLG